MLVIVRRHYDAFKHRFRQKQQYPHTILLIGRIQERATYFTGATTTRMPEGKPNIVSSSISMFSVAAAIGTTATRSEYVRRARLLEYWQHCSDDVIEREFERAKLLLMVGKRIAVQADAFVHNPENGQLEMKNAPRLAVFNCQELREKLSPFGLLIGTLNSALLDVWGPADVGNENPDDNIALFGTSIYVNEPPQESGIPKDVYREQLSKELGVHFLELRHAMLTIDEHPKQREWLAKFQSIMRWFWVYLHCPTCKNALQVRASKSTATCLACEQVFYPTLSPVAIVLVRDESNDHALLVGHKRTASQIFTCISGFSSVGETLEQTVQREVAEEVGIQCWDIKQLPGSQSWPIPQCSMMIPFVATACREDKLETSIAELEYACWFSRDEVLDALKRVEQDPFMLGLQRHMQICSQDPLIRKTLRYIPPKGAIAHHIIKNWVESKI